MAISIEAEASRIRKKIEILKAQAFDPLLALDRIPTPLEFGEAILGNKLDGWQRRYMKWSRDVSHMAIVACRQSGKSTVTGLFVAWCLLFIPGFQCLVASRSLRQASHFLNNVRMAVLSVVPRQSMRQLNRLSMELPNGSMIISIPCAQPDAGRGFSPHLVILDEAAFAPEQLFVAISPSLAATNGAMHMLSSPNGRQGYFFEAVEGESSSVYKSLKVPYTLCPRITEETAARERVALGDIFFRQEYMAEFVTPMGAFFGHSAILNMEEEEDPPLDDLELADLETLLDTIMPVPMPSVDDLKVALDRSDRMRRVLYE
jgi:Phage Terminase